MRVLPGSHQYACNANWKLMVENSIDGYHGAPLHHTYFAFLASQGDDDGAKQLETAEARGYDLGNGHAVVDYTAPFPRAIARWHPIFGEDAREEIQAIRDELARRHGEERACRMAETCRNLFIYPNLLPLDVAGLTIRTVWPLRPDYMELSGYALAPREEGPREAGAVDELQMRAFWREWQSNLLGAGHAAHEEGRKPAAVASSAAPTPRSSSTPGRRCWTSGAWTTGSSSTPPTAATSSPRPTCRTATRA